MLWRAMLLLITIVIVGIASPFDALRRTRLSRLAEVIA
jgi:hypothetical protein